MNHRGRWRIGALASAVALLGSLASLQAHAVALGRITVQSALGESLRAEIDISDLSAEEASSLRISVAGADVFKSAGLEYSAAAAGLDIKLQKRANGRSFLRLSSNRAVTDPFVDLILEARSASGRVTRDYTLLFDPPSLRANGASLVASAPVLPRETGMNSALAAQQELPATALRPPARLATAVTKPAANLLPPAERIPGARQITVKPGDNASKIAAQNKPASVSLDQMLAALLKGNPEAFVGGDINLIKSGAVVDIPDERAASGLSSTDAKKTLVAQSRDFNTFRRRLADGLPVATPPVSADRQASGRLQARVDDRAQAATSPDKLTLSKGAVQGAQSGEFLPKDVVSRSAELPKNSNAGNPLPAAPGTVLSVPPMAALPPGGPASPASANPSAITAVPSATASPEFGLQVGTASALPASGAEAAAAVAASVPAASQEPAAAGVQSALIAPAVAPPAKSLMDWLIDNSLLLGGGVLLALLAGLGILRYRKGQRSSQMDSSFLDSRLQPDSFFGASGGQRVDTSVSNAGKSSIAYSPSQLDAAGDVDPVAEADVYLAYGRDQQAEDILKEALRTYPARIAIHTKLLEIFAKRRDHKAFESAALAAFKLSGGQGPEWIFISQLGRQLEPGNSLYQPGTGPSDERAAKNASGALLLATNKTQDTPAQAPVLKPMPGLDLDLGFSPNEALAASAAPRLVAATAPSRPAPAPAPPAGEAPPSAFLDLDLDLDDAPAAAAAGRLPLDGAQLAKAPPPEIDFLAAGLDFTPEPFLTRKAAAAPPLPVNHDGMLEFDLSSLSLELGPEARPAPTALPEQDNDPLEVKFLLAEEFRILGDADGARSLADEVVAKAMGPLKFKAQAFLNTLS